MTSFIEASEDRDLAELLLPKINQTLHKLSFSEQAKARVHRATRALKSFAATFSMASVEATRRLDEGFFKVRFDRLTPKEREYVIAMAGLGPGPYRSSDVAERLGLTHQSLGPRRSTIIRKGMIYSPSHGDIAFTVPLFDEYLRRNFQHG